MSERWKLSSLVGCLVLAASAPALAQQPEAAEAEAVAPERPLDASSLDASTGSLIFTNASEGAHVPGLHGILVSASLRGVDVQDVLEAIAREGGVDLVIDEDVSGTITVDLTRVLINEALWAILEPRGLGLELRGGVIRVAPLERLVEEKRARAVQRESEPLEVFTLPLNYTAASDLAARVRPLVSERGQVAVDRRTNSLIVKDVRENVGPLMAFVSSLERRTPQILIEARFVEVSDRFARTLDIDWVGPTEYSVSESNPTGLVFPGDARTNATSDVPNYAVNDPVLFGFRRWARNDLKLGLVSDSSLSFSLRLPVLEEPPSEDLDVISAPKILTLDGHGAVLTHGIGIPVDVYTAKGVESYITKSSVKLTLTPRVSPRGEVQLELELGADEPDFQTMPSGDPMILRRSAVTELLVEDGATLVMGGLMPPPVARTLQYGPEDWPIIGAFFRSEPRPRGSMMVFITPRIVNREEALGSLKTVSLEVEDGEVAVREDVTMNE